MKFETTLNKKPLEIDIDSDSGVYFIDGSEKQYTFHTRSNGRQLLRIGKKLYKIDNVSSGGQTIEFTLNGRWCSVDIRDERDLLLDKMGFKSAAEVGKGELKAPMPGKILEIMANEGDKVTVGDPVAILEAMKMENELKAPVSGTVTSITAVTGESLEKNAAILEIEANG